MLVFDVDEQIELAALCEKLRAIECAFCVYSTHSHKRQTEKNPKAETRWRVCIPLETYAKEDSPSAFENFDLWMNFAFVLIMTEESARFSPRLVC